MSKTQLIKLYNKEVVEVLHHNKTEYLLKLCITLGTVLFISIVVIILSTLIIKYLMYEDIKEKKKEKKKASGKELSLVDEAEIIKTHKELRLQSIVALSVITIIVLCLVGTGGFKDVFDLDVTKTKEYNQFLYEHLGEYIKEHGEEIELTNYTVDAYGKVLTESSEGIWYEVLINVGNTNTIGRTIKRKYAKESETGKTYIKTYVVKENIGDIVSVGYTYVELYVGSEDILH